MRARVRRVVVVVGGGRIGYLTVCPVLSGVRVRVRVLSAVRVLARVRARRLTLRHVLRGVCMMRRLLA